MPLLPLWKPYKALIDPFKEPYQLLSPMNLQVNPALISRWREPYTPKSRGIGRETLNPIPQTLNPYPKPYTPNPKPYTLNPKP